MTNLTYSEIQDVLNQANFDGLPVMNISVLRNVMVEPVIPYLKFMAYQMGFAAKVKMGEYDNIVQEAIGVEGNLLEQNTDCVLIFLKLETLSWDLARNFSGLAPQKISDEIARIEALVTNILSGIRKKTNGMILWHGFEAPLSPSLGVWDSQTQEGQLGVISHLNSFLKNSLRSLGNAYFVDLNLCISRLGEKKFYDLRYWHIGRAPYSREALSEIALEDFKFIRALKGKNKKCLVLDCDNVLWGGIIGEDGLAGIKLGSTYPGSPYFEFQQEIVNLFHRGVIVALCSKNNAEDVWDVFRNHPETVLKEQHIAAFEINWDDKVVNLKKIANRLNIGLDSLVFIDDSEFEINLVRKDLPEISVIHLPPDRPAEYRNILASCGYFDTLTISAEDRERGMMYKAEADRKQLKIEATDLDSYLKSLEMIVEVKFSDSFALPRVAQLTQKTNQFNLTTRRYSETDIKNLMEDPSADVLYLKLLDRYGDSGIVGVCILKYREMKATIDTLLLSCRVLGRGVEDVFVSEILKLAKSKGCTQTIGEFYLTAKNEQVKDFFPKQGFEKHNTSTTGSAEAKYFFDLKNPLKEKPKYFKKIVSPLE